MLDDGPVAFLPRDRRTAYSQRSSQPAGCLNLSAEVLAPHFRPSLSFGAGPSTEAKHQRMAGGPFLEEFRPFNHPAAAFGGEAESELQSDTSSALHDFLRAANPLPSEPSGSEWPIFDLICQLYAEQPVYGAVTPGNAFAGMPPPSRDLVEAGSDTFSADLGHSITYFPDLPDAYSAFSSLSMESNSLLMLQGMESSVCEESLPPYPLSASGHGHVLAGAIKDAPSLIRDQGTPLDTSSLYSPWHQDQPYDRGFIPAGVDSPFVPTGSKLPALDHQSEVMPSSYLLDSSAPSLRSATQVPPSEAPESSLEVHLENPNPSLKKRRTLSSRMSHRPCPCPDTNCAYRAANGRDLRRHSESAKHMHPQDTSTSKLYPCPMQGCFYATRGFRRRDKLIRHWGWKHGDMGPLVKAEQACTDKEKKSAWSKRRFG